MDPLGHLPRGSVCYDCRRERFAAYVAGTDGPANVCVATPAQAEKLHPCKVPDVADTPSTSQHSAHAPLESDTHYAAWSATLHAPPQRVDQTLNVSTLAGMSALLVANLNGSVADLKRHIQASLGIEDVDQQLICGEEVLQPDLRSLKSFSCLANVITIPDLLVIKVARSARPKHMSVEGAQSAEANGTYTRANTNCYTKDGDARIRIFRYLADASWPAAWFLECGHGEALYYAVPDQTLGDSDPDAEMELGYPIPLDGWKPWGGSHPGELPAPKLRPIMG